MLRSFDLDEANRMVPSLEATFTRLRPWIARVAELTRDLSSATRPGELRALWGERSRLVTKIDAELAELRALGLEVRGPEGLIDFPAKQLGSERWVYMCWRTGEPSVTHWHPLDAGFAGRRLITETQVFARSFKS